MSTRTRVSRAQAYAEMLARFHGDPRERVRRIAARYGVQPQSVLNALRRYWGPRGFREEIPAEAPVAEMLDGPELRGREAGSHRRQTQPRLPEKVAEGEKLRAGGHEVHFVPADFRRFVIWQGWRR